MKGKVAIVTGGASGIGRAVVELLLRNGVEVLVLDIDEVALLRLSADMPSASLRTMVSDVSSPSDAGTSVDQCIRMFGRLDYLVNAAGIIHRAVPLHELTGEDLADIHSVNAFGSHQMYKSVVSKMIATKTRGAIVNILSMAATRPVPNAGGYVASKHALAGMTTTGALEVAPYGIRVNGVCPGIIDTPLFRKNLDGGPAQAMMQTIPAGRLGLPGEVANAVVWLLSDQASYITGAILPVDGGIALT